MEKDKAVEEIARWLRPKILKEVEGYGKDCITPWNECCEAIRNYWLKQAQELIDKFRQLGWQPPVEVPQDKVEKIRENLNYCYAEGRYSTKPGYRWSKERIIEYALDQICQLFTIKPEDLPLQVKNERFWSMTESERSAFRDGAKAQRDDMLKRLGVKEE